MRKSARGGMEGGAGAGFSGNLVIRDCKDHLHLMSAQGCQNERDVELNLRKFFTLSGYQITGNPAHINREAKEKERRKKEGGREGGRRRAEDERVWFRPHFLSPSLLLPSLPPRPTDRPTDRQQSSSFFNAMQRESP